MPEKKPKKAAAAPPAAEAAVPTKKRPRPSTAEEGPSAAAAAAASAAAVPKKKKAATMPVVEVMPEAAAETKASKKKKQLLDVDEAAEAPPSKKKKTPPKQEDAAAAAAAVTKIASPSSAAAGGRLDTAQVARAVRALLTHIQRDGAKGLLDGEAPINVLVGTKAMPKAVGKAKKDKPVTMALPHPFVTLDEAEVCLITKDPQREFKDKLADIGVRAKVIGVSKLKKKYHPHEAKRELCATYDIFLADARVLPMLPPLLGKTFFEKKKLPTAVDLKKKDLKAELTRAACGALYRHATGTSNSFQVGTSEQKEKHLVANVVSAVEQAVELTPGKWTNIQSLQLRTTNSVALPFYNSLPHA